MEGLPEFYELQLIILSIICLLSLLADRFSKTKRKVGDVVLDSGSLASLTRQYLLVYGIVMGPSPLLIDHRSVANMILQGQTGYRAHMCILYIENSTLSQRG